MMRPSRLLGGSGRGLSAILLTLSLGLPAIAPGAVEVTNLGPLTYMRNPGKPAVHTTAFPGVAGAGVLHIQNSGVSSAVLRLNDMEVVSPNAFNQQVKALAVPVTLIERNRIEIELRSKPGSSLTLSVTQEVAAEAAAVVGVMGGLLEVTNPASPLTGVKLLLPPGSLGEPVVIRISSPASATPLPPDFRGDTPIELEPSGLTLSGEGARLVIPTEGRSPRNYYWFDQQLSEWVLEDTLMNEEEQTFKVSVYHFSERNTLCRRSAFDDNPKECAVWLPCSGDLTYSVTASTANSTPGTSTSDMRIAVVSAANSWNSKLAGTLRLQPLPEGENPTNAQVEVSWSSNPIHWIGKNRPDALAEQGWSVGTGKPFIRFKDTGKVSWTCTSGWCNGPTYDVESIALHEFGHLLGLTHSCSPCFSCQAGNPVMSDGAQCSPCRQPKPLDVQHLQALYPPAACSTGLSGWGTATIDGVMGPSEWGGAGTHRFQLSTPAGPRPATLYLMNDSQNLYMAVEIGRPDFPAMTMFFSFDAESNGVTLYDDAVSLASNSVPYRQDYFADRVCARTECFAYDNRVGGTSDGAFAATWSASWYRGEWAHPLDSGDINDFSLVRGQLLAFTIGNFWVNGVSTDPFASTGPPTIKIR